MKIAITGHKRGIGRQLDLQLTALGHRVVGISRSDGENIRRVAHTATLIEDCDMFINNAVSAYAQTELLFEVWHRWAELKEAHHIWNISTRLCLETQDRQINGLTMRESMEYRNRKMSLELAHSQLAAQASNIKMKLIRPPGVRTQAFSDPNGLSAEEYVHGLLEEQGLK
jgi:hypothetical protein